MYAIIGIRAMAKNKKQHYVPISWFKAFANPDEHVWKMDRWTGKIEPEGKLT